MTSLCALPGSLLAGACGFIIERTGFENFFIGTSLIGIPVALLAWFIWRNHPPVAAASELLHMTTLRPSCAHSILGPVEDVAVAP